MRHHSEILENGEKALVFKGAGKRLVGVILTAEKNEVAARIFSPETHPPGELEQEPRDGQHIVSVHNKRYVAVNQPEPVTISKFLETISPDQCSEDMLKYLRLQITPQRAERIQHTLGTNESGRN